MATNIYRQSGYKILPWHLHRGAYTNTLLMKKVKKTKDIFKNTPFFSGFQSEVSDRKTLHVQKIID